MRKTTTFLLGAFVVVWTGYTLSAVARYGGAVLADLSTTGRIMAVRNDELVYSAVGLTYHGVIGAMLVVVEIIVVWTALWLGNAIWLRTRGWDSPADFAIMVAAMFVTLAWAGQCFIGSKRNADLTHLR